MEFVFIVLRYFIRPNSTKTAFSTKFQFGEIEWLYILNNLKKISEIPLSLVGNKEYEKVFELAEVANLTREEMCEYNQRLKIQRDNYSVMENAREEGRIEERKEIALKLKAANATLNLISETTGFTIEQIESL